MNLELSLKQTLKLTPQLLQSMQVLQMSTQELADYMEDLVQTNPAAELTEPAAQGDESEELWRRMQSLADADHQNRQYLSPDREELDPLARVGTDGGLDETLTLHLTRQLERSHAPTLVLRRPSSCVPAWTRTAISGTSCPTCPTPPVCPSAPWSRGWSCSRVWTRRG